MNCKKLLAQLFLSFLVLQGLAVAESSQDFSCTDSECIENLLEKSEDIKSQLLTKQCLPQSESLEEVDLEEHFNSQVITEECLSLISEWEENNSKIEQVASEGHPLLNSHCAPGSNAVLNNETVDDLAEVDAHLQCSEEMRQEHKKECADDFKCALGATANTFTGGLSKLVGLDKIGGENCDLNEDSCLVQLATGFIKGVHLFFEGTWELLKMAGRGVKSGLSNMWNWMKGAEDHSSTAQLAAAQASQDDGVFKKLIDDFPGTMQMAWEGLSGALTEWLKNDIFCSDWEGIPHYSECLKPAVGFDCLSCKQKIRGLCGLSGVFISEVVPAFLTGGLITSIKHGASAASKIAKSFKVSSLSRSKLKASSLSKYASPNYASAAKKIKSSKVLTQGQKALKASMAKLNSYLAAPSTKYFKRAREALNELASKNGVKLVKSGTQKFFSYSSKAVGSSLRVALYPIENPLTRGAYSLGSSSFDNVANQAKNISLASKATTLGRQDSSWDLLDNVDLRLSEKERAAQNIQARAGKDVTVDEVLENSRLGDEQRVQKAFESLDLNEDALSPEKLNSLKSGLLEAHEVGQSRGAGVFDYNFSELRQKRELLRQAGFSDDQSQYLIRSGLAGRPPTRQVLERAQTQLADHYEDLTKQDFLTRKEDIFKHYDQERAPKGLWNRIFNRKDLSTNNLAKRLDALHFVDYSHSARELADIGLKSKGRKLSSLHNYERYESRAFKNFRRTRQSLLEEKPDINLETLQDIHSNMMAGRVEGVKKAQLGEIRERQWYGNVPKTRALSQETVDVINANPYLHFAEQGQTTAGKYYGRIPYPTVYNVKPEALNRIGQSNKELVEEILKAKRIKEDITEAKGKIVRLKENNAGQEELRRANDSLKALQEEHAQYANDLKKYNKRLTEALTRERFDWFARRRAKLGDLDSPEKVDEYVDSLAELQRDLVSIHPLNNGNGRSTRMLLLDYGLQKEGLPPATLLDPNLDIYSSLDQWKETVRAGVLATNRRMQDIEERIRFDLPLENSIEIATPHNPAGVQLELKVQGSIVERQVDGVEHIDPRQYRELAKRELEADQKLMSQIENSPSQGWREIDSRVEQRVKENNLYYRHKKFGEERVEINVIDDDFKHLFGRATYSNPDKYNFKMDTWYDDDITWRGLSSKRSEKSEAEIINMFKELDFHMASNKVVGGLSPSASPEAIRKKALKDFDQYNQDIFDEGLVRMAKDHSETGPLYSKSYGYSTSKSRTVGKAFAMGAMVVADYGKHHEFQHLLKSRVLVGARKAKKDVDLTRLKQVRDDFSYKYGRQQEVMGIGAADPDAITIVQTLDESGEVIKSYLRHPENPSEVLVIRGEATPGELPDPDRILKQIQLKDG